MNVLTSPLLVLLCVVSAIWPAVSQVGDKLKFFANDRETAHASFIERTEVKIACWYEFILWQRDNRVSLEEPSEQLIIYAPTHRTDSPYNGWFLNHTIHYDEAYGTRVFICHNQDYRIQLTVTFGAEIPSTQPSLPPSSSSSPSPSSTHANPKTSELKPLIYTIGSVVLLGTLAVVAIITCWIRARRSFNQRVARSNNAPQDYLDYISDNEFTPLTASEFSASLQERPPTYNESQRIEDDMRQDDDDSSSNQEEGETSSSSSSRQPGTTTTAITETRSPRAPPVVEEDEDGEPQAPERCPNTGQETEQQSSPESQREREINDRFQQNIAEIFGIEFLD